MSNADFEAALKVTLGYEGKFVNNPADPGGATNYGVTQAVYNAYRQRAGLGVQTVRLISAAEVHDIYKTLYWDVVTQGRIWPLNVEMFDAAVNSGPKNAEWMLSEAKRLNPQLNALQPEALRQKALAGAMLGVRRGFFRTIVRTRPASSIFLGGWLRRCDQLEQVCAGAAPLGLSLLSVPFELPEPSMWDFTPRTDDITNPMHDLEESQI